MFANALKTRDYFTPTHSLIQFFWFTFGSCAEHGGSWAVSSPGRFEGDWYPCVGWTVHGIKLRVYSPV